MHKTRRTESLYDFMDLKEIIMKKLLLCTLAALMVFALGVAVSAENEYGYQEVGDWYVGKGFPIAGTDGEVSKPIVTEGDGFVNVATGGWYTDGAIWGGIASKDLYMLDGLEVELQFSKVVDNGERWINIGFFEKPDIFKVSDIASNRGYGNLIRPSAEDTAIHWNHIEAIKNFAPTGPVLSVPFTQDLKLTMKVQKLENGNWQFVLNDNPSPEYASFAEVFKGDRAYIVIATSAQHAIDKDSFKYTVKVTGEKAAALTEDEVKAWDEAIEEQKAAAKAEAERKAAEAQAQREAERKAREEAEAQKEAMEEAEAEGNNAAAGGDVVVDEGNNMLPIIIIIAIVVIVVVVIVVITGKKKK